MREDENDLWQIAVETGFLKTSETKKQSQFLVEMATIKDSFSATGYGAAKFVGEYSVDEHFFYTVSGSRENADNFAEEVSQLGLVKKVSVDRIPKNISK